MSASASADVITLSVPDMSCGHCVKTITDALSERLPDAAAVVDLPSKTVRVAAPVDVATAILADAGYEAHPA